MTNYKEIKFLTFQLLINDSYAESGIFEKVNEAWSRNFEDTNTTIHNVHCNYINNRYFTLYDNFGSPNPRPEHVYDKHTKTNILNPRSDYQAELKGQLFCIYDTYTKILYFNNSQKKSFIQKYLQELLSDDIVIKHIYKNIDEFVKTLKIIDKIKFIAHRNIFANTVNSFKGIKDIFGIEEPESFVIEANYNITASEKIKRIIEYFRNEQVQLPNSCLTCVGRDDDNMEQIFNEDCFSKAITIKIAENSEHLLNPKDVFEQLINRIENNG